ncbi:hypothetical protein RJ641_029146 [Dillenia turbinata]|uniref:RING-type domain-containing protein n=1 Tax=Dillenia turbinata TaxID=194707 RepID=A0AAN8ZMN8_9MAGN
MSMPNHQRHLQQQQSRQHFRNLFDVDGQISQQLATISPPNFPDQSHPPYVPPFHVAGFAPGTAADLEPNNGGGGSDSMWNYRLEPKKKRLKEQDFLDNSSQLYSFDFLQPRSVSTGLGLSLDNSRMACTGDSPFLALLGDDVDQELRRQDLEIDRFLRVQGDRLRQVILDKVQASQLQTISALEEKVVQKLHENEAEVESINKRNVELEERMEQLAYEVGSWQERAKYNENMINALKVSLQQIYAQSRDSKEGCGDSEVDDTASCCNGHAFDFRLLCKENNDMKELMRCKVCRVNEVCMLLLPCKHLCLCKVCESKLNLCPLCHSSKFIGMEVYM